MCVTFDPCVTFESCEYKRRCIVCVFNRSSSILSIRWCIPPPRPPPSLSITTTTTREEEVRAGLLSATRAPLLPPLLLRPALLPRPVPLMGTWWLGVMLRPCLRLAGWEWMPCSIIGSCHPVYASAWSQSVLLPIHVLVWMFVCLSMWLHCRYCCRVW